jgi:putative restriction endonuclease
VGSHAGEESGSGLRVWLARPVPKRRRQRDAASRRGAIRFGPPQIVRPRLGQGTFRVEVTDAYERACAVTGEHSCQHWTLHIRPYASDAHETSNGFCSGPISTGSSITDTSR